MGESDNGSDIFLGYVKNGAPFMRDYWVTGMVKPQLDTIQNVNLVGGAEQSGKTTLRFSRLLDTGDTLQDRVISKETSPYLIWALSTDDPTDDNGVVFVRHTHRGAVEFDWRSSSTCKKPDSEDLDVVWYNDDETFGIGWRFNGSDNIDFIVRAATKGWVGVGFSDTPQMINSDMNVFWISEGKSTVVELWNSYERNPTQDVELGGSNDDIRLSSIEFKTIDGKEYEEIRFSRLKVVNDTYDIDFEERKPTYLLWALGDKVGYNDGSFDRHTSRGVATIDLFHQNVTKVDDIPTYTIRSYERGVHGIVSIISFVVFIVVGYFIIVAFKHTKTGQILHVVFMMSGAMGLVISFVPVSKSVITQLSIHSIGGYASLLLFIVQSLICSYVYIIKIRNEIVRPLFSMVHQYLPILALFPVFFLSLLVGFSNYVILSSITTKVFFWSLTSAWTIVLVVVYICVGCNHSKYKLLERENNEEVEDEFETSLMSDQDVSEEGDKKLLRERDDDDDDDDEELTNFKSNKKQVDIESDDHSTKKVVDKEDHHHHHHHRTTSSSSSSSPSSPSSTSNNFFLQYVGIPWKQIFLISIEVAFFAACIYFITATPQDPTDIMPYKHCLECEDMIFKFDNFNVPIGWHEGESPSTAYACLIFDLNMNETYQIIEYEYIIDNLAVHHMILYSSPRPSDGKYFSCIDMPDSSYPIAFYAPSKNPNYVFPYEAGFAIGKDTGFKYLVLQVHYENTNLDPKLFDSSGFRLRVTPHLRPKNSGFIMFGTAEDLDIPPLTPEYEVKGTCLMKSTTRMPFEITIFGYILHMHKIGKNTWMEHKRDGEMINWWGNPKNKYDFYQQSLNILETPIKFKPGDEITIHCVYDSSQKVCISNQRVDL
eukprot:TRINITY_DN1373_c0_g1_i2.p1 TRINITY_DN1373_c0_g1~~TRINITY_DN1373_c0_g1_i2.p1  ORF type:complete len:947 (+),score=217.37 TRINITY_DN1373_c0_g1_i2:202-2841(+)